MGKPRFLVGMKETSLQEKTRERSRAACVSGFFTEDATCVATASLKRWKSIFGAMSNLSDSVQLTFKEDGLHGLVIDGDRTSMVKIALDSGSFDAYSAPNFETKAKVDLERVMDALKAADDQASVSVAVVDGSAMLAVSGKSAVDVSARYVYVPSNGRVKTGTASFVLAADTLLDIIDDVAAVSDDISFHNVDSRLAIGGNGKLPTIPGSSYVPNGGGQVRIKTDLRLDDGDEASKFTVRNIAKILKIAGNAYVKVTFGTNMPIMIEWKGITYLQAPYMKDVPESGPRLSEPEMNGKAYMKADIREWRNTFGPASKMDSRTVARADYNGFSLFVLSGYRTEAVEVDWPAKAFEKYFVEAPVDLNIDPKVVQKVLKRFFPDVSATIGVANDGRIIIKADGCTYAIGAEYCGKYTEPMLRSKGAVAEVSVQARKMSSEIRRLMAEAAKTRHWVNEDILNVRIDGGLSMSIDPTTFDHSTNHYGSAIDGRATGLGSGTVDVKGVIEALKGACGDVLICITENKVVVRRGHTAVWPTHRTPYTPVNGS